MKNIKINKKPIIWSISGADCAGSAGIAADIKTGHSLGVEVCHLITANTVQNAQELVSVNPVETDILLQQFNVLKKDKLPSVIKIGLLVTLEQVSWLVAVLHTLKKEQTNLTVIYDPVGQASVGGTLSSLTATHLSPLLRMVDVLTPNINEAKQLSGSSSVNQSQLAQALVSLGCNSVIIKGGHKQTLLSDDFCLHQFTNTQGDKKTVSYQLSSPRVPTMYTHGGGCSFASAIAAFIAHGYLLRDAMTLTKAYINQGLSYNAGRLNYYGAFEQVGWPEQAEFFPTIENQRNNLVVKALAFPSLALDKNNNEVLGLYPVIDSIYWLKRLLPLGLQIIQLRIKHLSDDELDQLISEAVMLSKAYSTRLFINDHWQLAIKHKAYGVHIGQEDLQSVDLSAIHQAGIRLGISTHGCYEFLLAQQLRPSYLAIGAIFPTKTKNMTGQIQGINTLKQIMKLSTDIPVVAIGGINIQRAESVIATGVDSIAVVTAITEAENPELVIRHFQQLCKII